MTTLNPTSLETVTYRQQGWNAISASNMERINELFIHLWGPVGASNDLGELTVNDEVGTVDEADAATQNDLTDSSGGTASTTISAVSGTSDDSNINNNFASITAELALVKADNDELRTQLNAAISQLATVQSKLNEVLAALRASTGCGVFGG